MKSLYYAVQRKMQKRGGKNEKDIAKYLAQRSGFNEGEILGILTELPKVIEKTLEGGESATIAGLGSFHVAITSDGHEHPEDIMPHDVRLSKVYFVADRNMVERLKGMKFVRYPLADYFQESELTSAQVNKQTRK